MSYLALASQLEDLGIEHKVVTSGEYLISDVTVDDIFDDYVDTMLTKNKYVGKDPEVTVDLPMSFSKHGYHSNHLSRKLYKIVKKNIETFISAVRKNAKASAEFSAFYVGNNYELAVAIYTGFRGFRKQYNALQRICVEKLTPLANSIYANAEGKIVYRPRKSKTVTAGTDAIGDISVDDFYKDFVEVLLSSNKYRGEDPEVDEDGSLRTFEKNGYHYKLVTDKLRKAIRMSLAKFILAVSNNKKASEEFDSFYVGNDHEVADMIYNCFNKQSFKTLQKICRATTTSFANKLYANKDGFVDFRGAKAK